MKGRRRSSPGNKRRTKKILLFAALCILASVGIFFIYRILGPNTQPFSDHKYFYIRTGSTYSDVLKALEEQGIVRHIKSFEWVAGRTDYPHHVRAGRYEIHAGMSSFALARLLRSGRQSPVNLVINKLRTKQDFIRMVSLHLEADSTIMDRLLHDDVYLRQFGLDSNTALCAVIPNTYEFFWNTTAQDVFERLEKEKEKFWQGKRNAEADSLGLTRQQVYILASIVEEETNRNSEKPLIASVYLNRFRSGMRLSADPTVKFAIGDFALRRITGQQTSFDSPYNTYRYAGLPPGPICTPSIKTIDAVLHTQQTDYLYFCARPDFSGYHVFAATYAEHLQNARRYQKALDSLNIH